MGTAGRPRSISKLLSTNDVGGNGTHQAGILVPKGDAAILSFFPELDAKQKNPRATISMTDGTGRSWAFNYIYYNNRFFGGTRNEYRLTGMTKFLREVGAREGDTLVFSRDDAGRYTVRFEGAEGSVLPSAGKQGPPEVVGATAKAPLQDASTATPERDATVRAQPPKTSSGKTTRRRLTIGSGWKVVSI